MDDLGRQVRDAHGQAAQAIDMMLADLRQKWRELSGGPSMTEGLRRFVAAVDWSVSRWEGCWCHASSAGHASEASCSWHAAWRTSYMGSPRCAAEAVHQSPAFQPA